ncbi:MAG: hypothetical protein ACRD1R_09490 [Acidobacteriota bacterium]
MTEANKKANIEAELRRAEEANGAAALHFVKDGPFAAADAHIVSRLMKYRQEADYISPYVFRESDYENFRDEGETLYDKVMAYLRDKGYA